MCTVCTLIPLKQKFHEAMLMVCISNALNFLFTSSSIYFINMLVKLYRIDLITYQWAVALSLKIVCTSGFLSIITPDLSPLPLPVSSYGM